MVDISERNFEAIIECKLLAGGPDACPGFEAASDAGAARETRPSYGTYAPGGYLRRTSQDYDADLCLDPEMVVAFVQATQPKEWEKLKKQYGDQARPRFLRRLGARRGDASPLQSDWPQLGRRMWTRRFVRWSKNFASGWLSF